MLHATQSVIYNTPVLNLLEYGRVPSLRFQKCLSQTRTHTLSPWPPQGRLERGHRPGEGARPPCSQPLGPPPGTLPLGENQPTQTEWVSTQHT